MRLKEPAVDEEFSRIYLYSLCADYNSVIIYKLKVFLSIRIYLRSLLFVDETLERVFILRSGTLYNQYYLAHSSLFVIMSVTLAVIRLYEHNPSDDTTECN